MLTNKAHITITPCTGSGKASGWTPSSITYDIVPKSIKTSGESMAEATSGRDLSGNMHLKYIKSNVRKLEVELPPFALTDTNYNTIMNAVQGTVSEVTYWDIYSNSERTAKMYCSNSNGDYYSGIILNGIVQGATFNLIEM